MVATFTRKWKFFEIEGGVRPQRFSEMQTLTVEEAVEAVAHTALFGGKIELYLDDEDPAKGCPLVGLVFDGGVYTGHGLGSDETEELEGMLSLVAGEPLMMFAPDEKGGYTVVDDGGWGRVFTDALVG